MNTNTSVSIVQPGLAETLLRGAGEAALLTLSAAVPLAVGFSLNDSFDLPKMTIVAFGAIFVAAVAAVRALSAGKLIWRSTPLDVPLVGLLAVSLVAALLSIHRPISFFGQYREYAFGWLPLLAFCAVYWLTVHFATDVFVGRAEALLRGVGHLVAGYAILQYAGWEIFPQMPSIKNGRAWATLGNPVYLGAFLAMLLPLYWSALHGHSTIRKRFWPAAGLLLALSALVLTFSRSAWLGAAGALGIYLFGLVRSRHEDRRVLSVLAGLVLVVMFWAAFIPTARARFLSIFSLKDTSNHARMAGWAGGWEMLRANRWFGTGPDTYVFSFRTYKNIVYTRAAGGGVTQAHAHNDLLQWAATTGLIGLGGYLWVIVVAAVVVWKGLLLPGAAPRDWALAGSLAALFIQNIFNFSSVTTCFLTAFLGGMWFSTFARRRPPNEKPIPLGLWPARGAVTLVLASSAVLMLFVLQPVRADAMMRRAETLRDEQKWESAVRSYEQAISMNPMVDEYHAGLLETYRRAVQGQTFPEGRRVLLAAALQGAERRVRMIPCNPDAYNALGVVQMWLSQAGGENRETTALESFTQALRLDPTYVEAWSNCARVMHLRGDFKTEAKIWRYVLDMDPKNATARRLLAGLAGAEQ